MRNLNCSRMGKLAGVAMMLVLSAASVCATTIGFEGFAPAGSLTNVNPGAPYTESGFTLTPSGSASAVFDAAYTLSSFPGDNTSWFGFATGNTIAMTGPAKFSLTSLVIGPSTIGSGVVSGTVTADVFGGGTLSRTFTGLSLATLETLNWSNLIDVKFTATSDAGLDNIVVNAVPEPGTLLLFGVSLGTLALRRRGAGA